MGRFPLGEFSGDLRKRLTRCFDALMKDYKKHSFVRVRRDCEYQEFRPSESKAILDEIDVLLGEHYGFSPEELDFIINYDTKYRMGEDDTTED